MMDNNNTTICNSPVVKSKTLGYVNWAFTIVCVQTILSYNPEDKPSGMVETEIVNAKKVLNYAMEAFNLPTVAHLFDFIKSQSGVVSGIDFMQLQQNLVWVCYQINTGGKPVRAKRMGSYYQRARFFADTLQILEHLINKQYLPDVQPDDLTNHAKDISKYEMHKKASKAAKAKQEKDQAVVEEAYQRIKLKFANEGVQMFVDPECPDSQPQYPDKVAVIQDYGTLVYPDGKQRDLGKDLARKFYNRLMEENGIKLKQNALKKKNIKK